MTPEQRALIVSKLKQSKPSAYEDSVKSVGSGLAKGAVDAAMIVPNLLNAAAAGPQYVYEGVFGEDRDDFQPWQPFYSSDDVTADSKIDYEPQTGVGKALNFPARIAGDLATPGAAGKISRKLYKPKTQKASKTLKQRSQAKYDSVEQSGTQTADGFIDDLGYEAIALHPKGRVDKAAGVKDAYDDALDAVLEQSQNKNLSIKEVKDLDSLLGTKAEEALKAGASTRTSNKIKDLQQLVRNKTLQAADAGQIKGDASTVKDWKEAVTLYSKSMKAKDIENIISNGMRTDNPQTAIKTGMRNLLKRIESGKAKGFNRKEVEAIEKAVNQSEITGLLRIFGSRLNPIIATSSQGVDGGLIAAAGSNLARGQAVRNVRGAAEKALETVADLPKSSGYRTQFEGMQAVNPSRGAKAAVVTGELDQGQKQEITPEIRQLILQKLKSQGAQTTSKPVDLYRDEQPRAATDDFYDTLAMAESSGNPNAKASTSTASGLFQFTDGTWRAAVNKWGNKHGITKAMKNDPQAQQIMVRELANDNALILRRKLNKELTRGDLYAAHFMGVGRAAQLLKAKNTANAAKMFPKEARANKPIFYNKDGSPRTVGEVKQVLERKVA